MIKDLIKISGGYTDVVDLTNHYFNPEINSQLMERYRPIKAHRDAFAELAKGLDQQNKRFYFLSGSYGTGKSHLCLMAANYFANPSNTMEMETFFQNYELAQKSRKLKPGEALGEASAKELKMRRKDGAYLVAICRHGLNLEFEGTILRAIEEAIKGTGLDLDTHYSEAIRKIREWESKKNDKGFYNDLIKYLGNNYEDWSIDDLVKGLQENKDEAFKIFRNCFKEVTTTDFSYTVDNLQDIMKDILADTKFKEKYKGLVIIYDEFGYALDDNHVKLNEMQEFAQFCATSNMQHQRVIFIGTGHKPFRNHGKVGDSVHYDTISHRVIEIGLQTQGMEDIIGAIVAPDKSSKIWKDEIEKNNSIFASFAGECKRLKLFDWLAAPIIEHSIIQNIYPMHPLATYALLQLAKEVAAENRSLFKFFSPKINSVSGEWEGIEPYSYPWYIDSTQVLKDGKLNLFTTDLLYEYFKDGIKTDNKKITDSVRQSIKNYQESQRALNKYLAQDSDGKLLKPDDVDELFYKILKAILINDIISNETTQISNTSENLCFALNASTHYEKEAVSKRLEILCKIGVLYLNKGIYELRKSDTKDIQRIVDDYKANPYNTPSNLLSELIRYVPNTSEEDYLEAKDYNTTYNEDKRLKCNYVSIEELQKIVILEGSEVDFFQKCIIEMQAAGLGVSGYEGTAIYVFCSSDEDIEEAKKIIKNNKSHVVVVCIPKKPFNVINDIQTLNAVEYIKNTKEYKDFGTLENAQLNQLKNAALASLRDMKAKWYDNKNVDWYATDGLREKVADNKKHDVANRIIERKYIKVRNTLSHGDFNKSHINIAPALKRILNETLEILIDLSQSIKIEYNLPENRGSRKYIQKCFVDSQVIKLLKAEGELRFYEPETQVVKFEKSFPGYCEMLREIDSYKGLGWKSFNDFIKKYYTDYGLGEIAVSLLFALARKFYGDSLRLKKNESDYIDLNINDPSVLLELVETKYPGAVLFYEPISDEQKQYFTKLHQLFIPKQTIAGKSYGVAESYTAIRTWWHNLYEVAKIKDFYSVEELPYIKMFSKVESSDPYTFIKKDLPESLGYQGNEVLGYQKIQTIISKLESIKSTVEAMEDVKKNIIREAIAGIFNSDTATDIDIVEAIRKWFNTELDQNQKDAFAKYHTNDSKALIKKINEIGNQSEYIFKTLPELFGLGAFITWQNDKTTDYLNKIRNGKKTIEDNLSPVGEVQISVKGKVEQDKNNIKHKGGFNIEIIPEKAGDKIYYTEDGSDPSDKNSQRKEIQKGEKIPVHGNKTIKFVVMEPAGKYGKVKEYKAIDESQKCKVYKDKSGLFGEEMVRFVFPKDELDVEVALKSLTSEIISANIITKANLEKILHNISDQLKSKK